MRRFFVKDYYDYYKTKRGYHPRSLNSNGGWNVTGTMSFLNQPILAYSNEIRSAVLIIHGEKAHSVYFSKDAYKNMIDGNPYTKNKELLIIPAQFTPTYMTAEAKTPFRSTKSKTFLISIWSKKYTKSVSECNHWNRFLIFNFIFLSSA